MSSDIGVSVPHVLSNVGVEETVVGEDEEATPSISAISVADLPEILFELSNRAR